MLVFLPNTHLLTFLPCVFSFLDILITFYILHFLILVTKVHTNTPEVLGNTVSFICLSNISYIALC